MPMGQLDEAVKAHRRALAAQQSAREAVVSTRARAEETRQALAAAMVAEALAGTAQVDIIKRTGYSRERVRSILRAGGVEAE